MTSQTADGPQAPPPASDSRGVTEMLTREQMIARGAYGFLTHAVEQAIPLCKVESMLTSPACPAWGGYGGVGGRSPVEVKYAAEADVYLLFAGIDLVDAARRQGVEWLWAFVEPDLGRTR